MRQRTIKSRVNTTGVGLHSGHRVDLILRPAPADTGIVFRRIDLTPPVEIRVSAMRVNDTRLASTLNAADEGVGRDVKVMTVEHLMSALAGLGVDNLYVDLTGDEVPILDGSAGSFVFLIQSAGLVEQSVNKKFLRVTRAIEVRDGDKWARLEPHFGFKLRFSISFAQPAINATEQSVEVDFATTSYVKDVARARTFVTMHDVESLLQVGLIQGGSLDNAIVVDDHRILNSDGLRSSDEFVKHKILDAIGDLYLVGGPLLAAYSAHKSGHALNNALLRKLLTEKAYEIMQFAERRTAPRTFALDWGFA